MVMCKVFSSDGKFSRTGQILVFNEHDGRYYRERLLPVQYLQKTTLFVLSAQAGITTYTITAITLWFITNVSLECEETF